MTRLLYYYPIVLAGIGTCLHLLGTVGLYQPDLSRGLHMIMYALAILVVIGLFAKGIWAYWLAVALFVEQAVMQPYWGYQLSSQGHYAHMFVACPLVMVALVILVFNQPLFVKSSA